MLCEHLSKVLIKISQSQIEHSPVSAAAIYLGLVYVCWNRDLLGQVQPEQNWDGGSKLIKSGLQILQNIGQNSDGTFDGLKTALGETPQFLE